MNLEDQYDRIFRYLFYRLHDEHTAEDLTQETFLRFLASRTYRDENRQLQYLYTIARNLCMQHYRDRAVTFSLEEAGDRPARENFEEPLLDQISLREALDSLTPEEREMLFLRYVNDVPVPVMSGLYKISRFAVYRKLRGILRKMRTWMEVEPDE